MRLTTQRPFVAGNIRHHAHSQSVGSRQVFPAARVLVCWLLTFWCFVSSAPGPRVLQLMDRELLPSLHKLEQQCEQYHEFAHTSQRNETLKRKCVAYNYMETERSGTLCLALCFGSVILSVVTVGGHMLV